MAKEIAQDGMINVRRPDRDFLLGIKNGDFNYDELVAKAEHLKEELDVLYDSSSLLEKPNEAQVDELLVNIIKDREHVKRYIYK